MGSGPSSQPTIPAAAQGYLNQTQGAIGGVAAATPNYTGSPLAASLSGAASNAMTGANIANTYYDNVMSGANLNPNSNPYLAGTIGQLGNQFQQTLGTGYDKLSAQVQAAGQGTSSGVAANTAGQFTNQALTDYTGQLSNLLMGQYNQGVQQQEQTYAQGNQGLAGALSAYNAGMTPQTNQYGAAQTLEQEYQSLLNGVPLASTQYGASPLGGILSGVGSVATGGANLYNAFA